MHSYSAIRKHPIHTFWKDVVEDEEYLDLTNENKFKQKEEDKDKEKKSENMEVVNNVPTCSKSTADSSPINPTVSTVSDSSDSDCQLFASDESVLTGFNFKCRPNSEDNELFNIYRNLGTRDYIGQRVLQVATILRNLSFIEENAPTLLKNKTFLRFSLLCACSRWGQLQNLGLDMLGNMALELLVKDLQSDLIAKYLLKFVASALKGEDRNLCITALEILNKLSQNEANEETLARCLEPIVYERVCSFLTIHDVMLLIYTLECLYSLSSLGEKPCNYIVNNHGVVDTLVSLVTVEGKSYGPKACIGMKLVETVPGGVAASQTGTSTISTGTTSTTVASSAASTITTTSTTLLTSTSKVISSTPQRTVPVVPQRLIAVAPTSSTTGKFIV